jgi:CRP-like cAMP-binding protein
MKEKSIEQAWQGPAQCRQCGIRDLVLFADLQHEDFRLIHKPIDELALGSGSLLYHSGDAPRFIYTVRSGSIKLIRYQPEGGQRIVRLLSRGDIAGLEALLGQPYQHEARVLESASLCRIPVEVIERLNRDTPRLYRQLMARWQRSVDKADALLTELSRGQAPARVARLLLHLADTVESDTIYLPSREDIGAMLGITAETTSRVTAEMRRRRIYTELDSRHARLDRERLREMAE